MRLLTFGGVVWSPRWAQYFRIRHGQKVAYAKDDILLEIAQGASCKALPEQVSGVVMKRKPYTVQATGECGHRSRYLSHAKRALYQLSEFLLKAHKCSATE